MLRIAGAHASLNRLGSDRNTFVIVTNKVVVTLIVRIFARAILLVLDGIVKFVTNIAVCTGLTPVVPLLKDMISYCKMDS